MSLTRLTRRGLIKYLRSHVRLAVAWDRHGSPVPRWTITRYFLIVGYGLDNTPTLLALHFTGQPPIPWRALPSSDVQDPQASVTSACSVSRCLVYIVTLSLSFFRSAVTE